jgi:hypothetical protein
MTGLQFVSEDDVVKLHGKVIKRHGGLGGYEIFCCCALRLIGKLTCTITMSLRIFMTWQLR